jgi:hypothetical protein
MTLLQPSDIPSRTGINDAITSEIAEHADIADTSGEHYDSGWLTLPGTPGAGITVTQKEYRVKNGFVAIRFTGTLTAGIAVTSTGGMTDILIGTLPAGARPGGGGISASSDFVIELNGATVGGRIFNSGAVNIAHADRTGTAYTLGAAGNPFVCISPAWMISA